jgi:hypothetical protein
MMHTLQHTPDTDYYIPSLKEKTIVASIDWIYVKVS